VLFKPTNLKVESSYTGAKKSMTILGSALYFEVDSAALSAGGGARHFAATCDVIVRREPAELYGQIYAIKCSLLQSDHASECKNVLKSERNKAPFPNPNPNPNPDPDPNPNPNLNPNPTSNPSPNLTLGAIEDLGVLSEDRW